MAAELTWIFGLCEPLVQLVQLVPQRLGQVVAELAMDAPFKELNVEHKNGAVVALDPRTGEVLAMVSRPAFAP